MAQKPSTGKYRFNTFADLTVTTQFNNAGVPLKSVLYHFNNGDVIDVQKMFFNDKGEGWEAQVSAVTEQNKTVPFSILTKVADTTPVTANISRTEKTFSGSTDGMVFDGGQSNNTTKQATTTQTTAKTFFTPKNIVIGVLAIGAILGLLKWKKVI
jgi:hypothetical protein